MLARTHLRWIAPILVLGAAAALRFWALDRPGALVFDELYYVRDAISQLAHGFPTIWPTDDPDLVSSGAGAFTDEAAYAVHPPLGKWLIGLGILVFGPESGWGWRSASALFGVLTVAVVMRLGWHLSRSEPIAWTAGFVLAIDGVHVTLSRVACSTASSPSSWRSGRSSSGAISRRARRRPRRGGSGSPGAGRGSSPLRRRSGSRPA